MLDDAEIFKGETFIRPGRGWPRSAETKEQISVRIDRDILTALPEAGPGWQINELLRRCRWRISWDGECVVGGAVEKGDGGLKAAPRARDRQRGRTLNGMMASGGVGTTSSSLSVGS